MIHTNSHIHSPYSFSCFNSIKEMFDLAEKDEVKILGINDFFSTKGFFEFSSLAKQYKIYPLLNIEFLAYSPEFFNSRTRINDPTNPGRIYFVGKGLNPNAVLSNKNFEIFTKAKNAHETRIRKMIDKINNFFSENHIKEKISYENIKNTQAKDFVGERHLAKEIKNVFKIKNISEDEIRNKFLKQNCPAFIEESIDSFLSIEDCINIIKNLGGIPCYPVLLDYKNGEMTEFEKDFDSLYNNLLNMGIKHLDVIPDRNDPENVKKFINFFDKKGFYILLGTEHNTSQKKRIRVTFKNNIELDEETSIISYKGCCSIAAHTEGNGENNIKEGENIIKSHI